MSGILQKQFWYCLLGVWSWDWLNIFVAVTLGGVHCRSHAVWQCLKSNISTLHHQNIICFSCTSSKIVFSLQTLFLFSTAHENPNCDQRLVTKQWGSDFSCKILWKVKQPINNLQKMTRLLTRRKSPRVHSNENQESSVRGNIRLWQPSANQISLLTGACLQILNSIGIISKRCVTKLQKMISLTK